MKGKVCFKFDEGGQLVGERSVGEREATDRTRSQQPQCSLNQTYWYSMDFIVYDIKLLIKFTTGLQENRLP